jgi:hypothetical protein
VWLERGNCRSGPEGGAPGRTRPAPIRRIVALLDGRNKLFPCQQLHGINAGLARELPSAVKGRDSMVRWTPSCLPQRRPEQRREASAFRVRIVAATMDLLALRRPKQMPVM